MSQIQGANNAQYSMSWLYSIQQSGMASAAGAPQGAGNADPTAFDPFSAMLAPGLQGASTGASPPFSLDAMSALISAQEQSSGLSPDQQRVFSELDANGDGTITQSELETDFGADNKDLADAVMQKLDTDGDGSVDQSEFAAGTRKTMRHHGHHGGGQAQGLDALMQATQAQSTQTTNNSDGSTTTTLTYADGSTVTTTTPAAPTNSDNSSSQGSTQSRSQSNLLEQLIKLQAQFAANLSPSTMAATI